MRWCPYGSPTGRPRAGVAQPRGFASPPFGGFAFVAASSKGVAIKPCSSDDGERNCGFGHAHGCRSLMRERSHNARCRTEGGASNRACGRTSGSARALTPGDRRSLVVAQIIRSARSHTCDNYVGFSYVIDEHACTNDGTAVAGWHPRFFSSASIVVDTGRITSIVRPRVVVHPGRRATSPAMNGSRR